MACILSISIQSQVKEVEIHKTYRRQMASRSAGPIDKRMLVSAFVISGPTLPSNSLKWSLLILNAVFPPLLTFSEYRMYPTATHTTSPPEIQCIYQWNPCYQTGLFLDAPTVKRMVSDTKEKLKC